MNPIVQEVEIAEAVLEQYLVALATAKDDAIQQRLGQDAAIGAAEQAYPEIWSRLDRARASAASTGRDLSHYDAVRAYVGTDAARGVTKTTTEASVMLVGVVPVFAGSSKTAEGNAAGVYAARDAIATFRNVFSDLPWTAPATQPVPDLRATSSPALVFVIIGVVVLAAAALVVYSQL